MVVQKVIRGIHKGVYHDKVITVEREGVRHEIPWDTNTVVEEAMLDLILDNKLGPFDSPEERLFQAAARKECARHVKEMNLYATGDDDLIKVGDIEELLEGMWAGWVICLESHGLGN